MVFPRLLTHITTVTYKVAPMKYRRAIKITSMNRIEAVIVQVAQLWQRDRAKLDTFSINVQRYSQNHAQNWLSGPPYWDIESNI